MPECRTCGFPAFRPGGHAPWCWTANPSQPNLGGYIPCGVTPIPLDVDAIVRRYGLGEPTSAIAESMGVSAFTIRSRLMDAGVTLRGQSPGKTKPRRRVVSPPPPTLTTGDHERLRRIMGEHYSP